jgi:acetyl-CoA carboxylase biotin carboxyl carrier protein
MHEVTAPMPGTFYRRPNPDEAPFVEVGDRVSAGDTVCIIEVMKQFSEVAAGAEGVISDIKVDNEGAVKAGQVLFVVDTGE